MGWIKTKTISRYCPLKGVENKTKAIHLWKKWVFFLCVRCLKVSLHKAATPWNIKVERSCHVLCNSAILLCAAGARTASDVRCARPEALRPGTAAPLISCPRTRQADAVTVIPLNSVDISMIFEKLKKKHSDKFQFLLIFIKIQNCLHLLDKIFLMCWWH